MRTNDNTRGFRRVVRRIQSAFLAKPPFSPGLHHKGPWERFTRAPAHVWQQYHVRVEGRCSLDTALRCIVLSDLHVGSHADDLCRIQAIVDEVLAKPFDIALLPGDFVNMQIFGGGRVRPAVIAEILSPLTLRAPAVAVLGNHDAEYGCAEIARALEEKNIRVLFNESVALDTRAGVIHVAGLEDHSTGNPDAARALSRVPPDAATLMIAHDPASFADVPAEPLVTICGHTHGGQICLPLIGPVVNASSAPMGWTHGHIVKDGRHLIVSAGLGTSGLPWRWNCPPEVVEVTFTD